MSHYAGLGVSPETTSVRIVGADGKVVLEGRVAGEPAEVIRRLAGFGPGLGRVGMEAGPPSEWLAAPWRTRAFRWSAWRRGRRRRRCRRRR